MTYLLEIKGHYYFCRRVPGYLKNHDQRKEVRTSLFTDSRKEAVRLAILKNEELENYWRRLVAEQKKHTPDGYKDLIRQSRLSRLQDTPVQANFPANKYDGGKTTETFTNPLTIQEGLSLFWDFAKNKTISKSANQLRKWKNPRKAAVTNLINCIGDKIMQEVTRADILKFRDWWIMRIQEENLGANAANKNFVQVKVIFETVSDNLNLAIDTKTLFKKLLLDEQTETTRLPFDSAFIRDTLLDPLKLSGLHEQEKWILYAFSETGAGLSELLSLRAEDIHLDEEVPYIEFKPRHTNALKTRYRKRTIPLVGYALDAFKACPQGFTAFCDRPDGLSTALNKYLRENGMLPTENHSVYSLRHSFQDRLLAADVPDRVQADLMGHKFNRPAYGKGASLSHKKEWLKKIQLKLEICNEGSELKR